MDQVIRKTRRVFLKLAAAFSLGAFALSTLPAVAEAADTKKVLFLTKSTGFQHSVVTRDKKDPEKPAHAERILKEIGEKNGFEVTYTKDASVFNDPETYKKYDVFAFYTTEDLTKPSGDGSKPMSKEGKEMFLKAIEDGKGMIGFHCASDTFHSRNRGEMLRPADSKDVDPYISMIGGEFNGHGSQQKALMKVASNTFPGLEDLKEFEMVEEWYNLFNLSPDMHVILVQDTASMTKGEAMYKRPNFPATWAKAAGKGRVFYTSMGHREDVWTNPTFQKVVVAGLNWTSGNTKFDPKPNLEEVAPQPKKK